MSETNHRLELTKIREKLKIWLFDKALPLWWEKGADLEIGGFYERLNHDLSPDNIDRRTRVAARQVYSYALAKTMGYRGETEGPITQGLNWLEGPALRPDGMLHAVLTNKGDPIKSEFDFYDHAFALLAYASAFRVRPHDKSLELRACFIRDKILTDYAHPVRGFEEANPRKLPLKANPHMHMFEACLAWIEAGGDEVWKKIAGQIADLCLDKFLHPETGSLREFFDGDWNPLASDEGRIVEPGHQFEWAWLLIRWASISHDNRFIEKAKRLVSIGEDYGTDSLRGVTMNEIWDDFTPKDRMARLWPQTERMKAHVALWSVAQSDDEKTLAVSNACTAANGLSHYLTTETEGLYYDKMGQDGKFLLESAPASSLYHIICAIDELGRIK